MLRRFTQSSFLYSFKKPQEDKEVKHLPLEEIKEAILEYKAQYDEPYAAGAKRESIVNDMAAEELKALDALQEEMKEKWPEFYSKR